MDSKRIISVSIERYEKCQTVTYAFRNSLGAFAKAYILFLNKGNV